MRVCCATLYPLICSLGAAKASPGLITGRADPYYYRMSKAALDMGVQSARCAIDHIGHNAQNWLRLARRLRQAREFGKIEGCIARCRAAARSAACFAQIGDFLVLLEDFPKALEAYDQAVSKKSDLECRRGG